MTDNFRLISTNYVDDATLSASPALVATLPENNLKNEAIGRVARTTGLADQQILGDLAASSVVTAAALIRHNLSTTATWRLELFDGAGQTGNTVYDSGAVQATPAQALGDFEWGVDPIGVSQFQNWDYAYSLMFFTPATAASFRLTLSDASNADGYMEASRLFLSRHFEPMVNFEWGALVSWVDDSMQTRTAGGSLRTDAVVPHRRLPVHFRWLSGAEKTQLMNIMRIAGKRRDMMISAYPGDGTAREIEYSFHAKIVNDPEFKPTFTSHRHWETQLEFEEV